MSRTLRNIAVSFFALGVAIAATIQLHSPRLWVHAQGSAGHYFKKQGTFSTVNLNHPTGLYESIAVLTAALTGCPLMGGGASDSPLPDGLRVYTYESASPITDDFPVDGVADYGNVTGPGGSAGAYSFSGITSSGGIDDHYGISLGTSWSITIDWTSVIPECGVDNHQDVFLDPSGDFVEESCLLW